MNILPYFSLLSHAYAPAALATATAVATALLARSLRARGVTPAVARRRLQFPRGVARWAAIVGVFAIALVVMGVDLRGIWSVLVPVLSLVAIGFVAMWSILSHILASILLVIFRPFKIGDRVEVIGDDTVLGEVTDLNPVYTTLRADDGGTLQVPNNIFFQKVLKRHASALCDNGGGAEQERPRSRSERTLTGSANKTPAKLPGIEDAGGTETA